MLEKLKQELSGISTTLKGSEREHRSCHLSIHCISPPPRGCAKHTGLKSRRGVSLDCCSEDSACLTPLMIGDTRDSVPSAKCLETSKKEPPRHPAPCTAQCPSLHALLLLSSPARDIHTCLSALPGTMRPQSKWFHFQKSPSSLSAAPSPCWQWYHSPLASLYTAQRGHWHMGCAAR